MTGQFSDSFRLGEDTLGIQEVRGEGLFEPTDVGWRTAMSDTACWRGFVAGYALHDDRLVLERLTMSHADRVQRNSAPPKLDEWSGSWVREGIDAGSAAYENMQRPVRFTGDLFICSGFHREYYVHMGFQAPWKYTRAEKLTFEDGALVGREDLSATMAAIREDHARLKPGPDASKDAVKAYVDSLYEQKNY